MKYSALDVATALELYDTPRFDSNPLAWALAQQKELIDAEAEAAEEAGSTMTTYDLVVGDILGEVFVEDEVLAIYPGPYGPITLIAKKWIQSVPTVTTPRGLEIYNGKQREKRRRLTRGELPR